MSAAPVLSGSEVAVRVDETGGLDVTTVAMDATCAALQLQGEMDLFTADLFTAVIASQLSHGRRFIRLDVSRLAFCDCAGLRAIAEAHNDCLGARGTLVLTGVTPAIARLLTITRMDEALLIADGPGDPRRTRQPTLAVVDAQ